MLDTFAHLQASVADFLNRDDLTTQIPDFITLAESSIRRRLQRKTIRTTITASAESTVLPADCSEVRSITPITGFPSADYSLKHGTIPMLEDLKAQRAGTPGRPQMYAVQDVNLLLGPVPDQSYSLRILYFQSLAPLSDVNTTNVVLTEAPDIYLYGTLLEAAGYLEHDERIQVWQARFDQGIAELNRKREREETAGALTRVRLARVF